MPHTRRFDASPSLAALSDNCLSVQLGLLLSRFATAEAYPDTYSPGAFAIVFDEWAARGHLDAARGDTEGYSPEMLAVLDETFDADHHALQTVLRTPASPRSRANGQPRLHVVK